MILGSATAYVIEVRRADYPSYPDWHPVLRYYDRNDALNLIATMAPQGYEVRLMRRDPDGCWQEEAT
jgi:hypothetical protein